jgi:F-type H+-transporting ATPase subunit b
MDKILHDLGELLLKAVPTLLLVGLLYFYLKRMFFRPLERLLAKRQEATEGTRQLAEETFAQASAKAAQYQEAIRAARAGIYREQEHSRRQWQQEHAAAVQEARRNAEGIIQEADRRLQSELAEAKRTLQQQADGLATQLAERVLARRAG